MIEAHKVRPGRPQRVAHVIAGLGLGGAERILLDAVRALPPPHWQHTCLSLQSGGALAAALTEAGACVQALGMRRGRLSPVGLAQLAAYLQAYRPPVVQGWMYIGNLVAQAAAAAARFDGRLLWSAHQAAPFWQGMSLRQRLVALGNVWGSGRVHGVWYVAPHSARAHAAAGFRPRRTWVVPGGVDTAHFAWRPGDRQALRAQLGLPEDTPLVGLIARRDPAKAHEVFLQAAARAHVAPATAAVHYVLVGEGLSALPPAWRQAVPAALVPRLHALGPQADVAPILRGLDVCTLSSDHEAMPKVVLEAMACEVPCVTTAVGICAEVLADVGWVVPRREPGALAAAWGQALRCLPPERRQRLARGRRRIELDHAQAQHACRLARLWTQGQAL